MLEALIIYFWMTPPLVLNCSTSPYTEQEVYAAMEYWELRGFEFGPLINNHPCKIPLGGISIDTAVVGSLSHNVYGACRRYTENHELLRAEITVQIRRRRVLEHELGHALGLGHDWQRGIMNPQWNLTKERKRHRKNK